MDYSSISFRAQSLVDPHSEAPDASGKVTTQEDGGEANELDKALSTAVVGPAPSLLDANKVKAVPAAYQFAQSLDATREVPAYKDLFPNMARKYPFHLDLFQQQAALCLEKGESVFVAAHTSAGKTVVAEYAVALCQLHQTRAIYTSPIKALSNQKFREFKLAFEDVGLVTGDIQLHPEAFCLIMTTEILRSMLYNGSEVIRELEWVIFDEVHYINDTERGHVWEEVLIMLPSHVKLIMLSATAPNCMEFADWVGRIKNRIINVITTPKRPVPLEHFLYTGQDGKTKNDRFLLVDKTGQYLARGYSAASQAKANLKKATSGPKGYRPTNKSDKNVWISLIDHLKTNDLLPAVAFVFSRQRCDDNAAMLTTIDLTTQKEKAEVHAFFVRCISRLKGSDRKLPQVTQMQELCKRGLAVHHSGILPILKEVVELLFQQGYVKILFATETFAMGVNMPARTVVFDSMQKHDGREMRNLNPGEYIQMAGRAGRRGLDSTGTVILLCKGPEAPDPTSLTQMMMGTPTKLESQFRVTYSMLLNLLRVEQLRVEDMLQRSYVESASLRQGMSRKIRLKEVEERLKSAKEPDCRTCTEGNLPEYHSLMRQFVRLRSELWTTLTALPAVDKMLTPCRVVIISHGAHIRNRVALILKTATNQKGQKSMSVLISVPESEQFETLSGDDDSKMNEVDRAWRQETLTVMDGALVGLDHVAPPKPGSRSTFKVLPDVPVEALIAITTKVVKGDMGAVLNDWQLREQPRFRSRSPDAGVMRLVAELDSLADEWQKSGPPIVTPGKDFQCSEMSLVERVHSLKQMKTAIAEFACHHCISFGEHLTQHREVVRLREERDQLAFQLSAGSLLLMGEYEDKLKVLRTMDYVDANNLVGLKGKVGCEIHHMELLITELMLENKFNELSSAEIAAMLSCTTCQFRARGEQSKLKPHLQKLKEDVLAVAAKITRVQHDCGVRMSDISEELRFDLIEVVYEWANGVPFSQIMQLTDAQEGLIVRCIQRLNE
uniref:Uncharacterized protein n=1 Tax=Plectus sambesii TaxID=2011161 RepID=A0A914X265_9BILA